MSTICFSNPITFISRADAKIPVLLPIRPRPIIPNVLPLNSLPRIEFLIHRLSFRDWSANGIERARLTAREIVNSATALVEASTDVNTGILFFSAVEESILSIPVPGLQINSRIFPELITDSVIFVLLRTTTTCTSVITSSNSSGVIVGFSRIVKPDSFNKFKKIWI